MRYWFFTALLCLCASAQAAESLDMVTGAKTGTYIAIGRDIAVVGKDAGVTVNVRPSGGSIDNIRRLNSRKPAALGIAQSDVLGFMARSKKPEMLRLGEHLRMVFPLYHEEVHVLAREGVHSFAELAGKKVVVGEDGSGHMVTAMNLFGMTGVTPGKMLKKSPPEGLLELLDGKVDALIFVGGKPIRLFKNLESLRANNNSQFQALLAGLHFLPLDDPKMLAEYAPAEITHADYGFVKEPVPTIAVTAVLVDVDFSGPGKAREAKCRAIGTLAGAIRRNLKHLQAHGHPKWKEVKLDNPPAIWKKDVCALVTSKLRRSGWEPSLTPKAKPQAKTRHLSMNEWER